MEKNQGNEPYQMERSNSGPPKTEIQAMRYRGNTLPVKITQNNFEDALSQRVNFDHRGTHSDIQQLKRSNFTATTLLAILDFVID